LPGDTIPIPSSVQKDFTTPLTLSEAVDLALCNNPKVQAAWANIKSSAAAVGEARSAYLPTLAGSLGRIEDDTSFPGSGFPSTSVKSTMLTGSFSWRIFDFGERSANHKEAESLLAAAIASHNAALQKTLNDVIQAYFDAYTDRAALNDKIQDEEIATNTLASAQKREVKGVSDQSDTLQATTAIAKATLDKNRAQGNYQKALSVLVYALGVPSATPIILPDALDEKTAAEAGNDLDDWLAEAQKSHPAIVAARAQLEAAQKKVAATRAGGLPTLDISANYYQDGRPDQSLPQVDTHETMVGITLTIPIFDGFDTIYKVREAKADAEQKEAELVDIEHQTLMAVVEAHADAVSALKNMQASEDLLNAAQHALAVSKRRYDKGAADILELLNAQSALADAGQERTRCLAEWRSARLRLLASAGQLGRSAVEK
jgi:outer membrane protein